MRLAQWVTSIAMLGLFALPSFVVEPAKPVGGSLTLTPAHGVTGGTVVASGQCVRAPEGPASTRNEVALYWDNEQGQRLVTAPREPETPDRDTFTASFRVPQGPAPGAHQVLTSCGARAPFIVDLPAATPRLAARPTQAGPDGVVTVTAEVLPSSCEERYRLLLSGQPAATQELRMGGDRLELSATVPGTATPGTRTFELQCPAGRTIASTPFEVLGVPPASSTSRPEPPSTGAVASPTLTGVLPSRSSGPSSTSFRWALVSAFAAVAIVGAVITVVPLRNRGQRWVRAHVEIHARRGRRGTLAFRTLPDPRTPKITISLRPASDPGSREVREVRVES